MTINNYPFSRRQFLNMSMKGLGAGAVLSSGLLNTACSLKPYSNASYLQKVVKPENNSPIYYWTDIMLQTVRDQAVNPPLATRAFAMGHLAGFIALNGIDPRYENHIAPLSGEGPRDADPEIAYGVACAYAIGDAFQSSMYFNRRAYLDQFPDSEAKVRAIQWGESVGKAVVKLRTQDGAEISKSNFYLGNYDRRGDVMQWSPTGPFYGAEKGPSFNTFSRGLLPSFGKQKPWVMKNTSDFLAPEFPAFYTPEFARQFAKVKALGGLKSNERSEDQTQIAFFWEDGPRGITPPGHWQLLAMDLLQDLDIDFHDQARIFTLLSMGQADAGITTWDSKFYHDILRPETAIRVRAPKFNNPDNRVIADPSWQSLIPTPSFPAYTSGHSTFSAVSAKILALAIGRDNIRFSGASPDLVNWPQQLRDVRRSWPSLSAAADEAGASREYGGIHWEADNVEGLKIGRKLGQYVFENAFKRKV